MWSEKLNYKMGGWDEGRRLLRNLYHRQVHIEYVGASFFDNPNTWYDLNPHTFKSYHGIYIHTLKVKLVYGK